MFRFTQDYSVALEVGTRLFIPFREALFDSRIGTSIAVKGFYNDKDRVIRHQVMKGQKEFEKAGIWRSTLFVIQGTQESRAMDLQSFRGCLLLAVGLVFFLCGGCATPNRPTPLPNPIVPLLNTKTHSEFYGPLETFGETYARIKKYYVDEVSHPQLIPAAIKGMDKWVSSQNKSYANPALVSPASSGGETEALKWFIAAYGSLQQETDAEPKELGYAAIEGMMKGLDPDCSLLTPDMYREMQRETKSSFGSIGVQIGIREGRLVVIAPIEGGPAHRAGIQTGDVIANLNNEAIEGLNLMEVGFFKIFPVHHIFFVSLSLKRQNHFRCRVTPNYRGIANQPHREAHT